MLGSCTCRTLEDNGELVLCDGGVRMAWLRKLPHHVLEDVLSDQQALSRVEQLSCRTKLHWCRWFQDINNCIDQGLLQLRYIRILGWHWLRCVCLLPDILCTPIHTDNRASLSINSAALRPAPARPVVFFGPRRARTTQNGRCLNSMVSGVPPRQFSVVY